MKKEYDVKKLKVKRRGVLPGLQGKEKSQNKVRVTIALDKDVIDFFKSAAEEPGAFPYQTQINQALRHSMKELTNKDADHIEELKAELLSDADFIKRVAKKVAPAARQRK
jgi:uncharacterized protein (DUF4415 family)